MTFSNEIIEGRGPRLIPVTCQISIPTGAGKRSVTITFPETYSTSPLVIGAGPALSTGFTGNVMYYSISNITPIDCVMEVNLSGCSNNFVLNFMILLEVWG